MAKPPGMCYCCIIHDAISLRDLHNKDRTSLCHCGNCKKFTGGNYGATTKLPRSAFTITRARDQVRVHEADNGSDVKLHRGFWGTRDGPLLEDGENAAGNFYVFYGPMEYHAGGQVEPKGDFFLQDAGHLDAAYRG